jgi:hypothetical protein
LLPLLDLFSRVCYSFLLLMQVCYGVGSDSPATHAAGHSLGRVDRRPLLL